MNQLEKNPNHEISRETKLKFARTTLMLLYPFYGILLQRIRIVILDNPPPLTAMSIVGDIENEEELGMQIELVERELWTDGKAIKINGKYLDNISPERLVFEFIHIITHIAFFHNRRCIDGHFKVVKYNYAADIAVNLILKEDLSNNNIDRYIDRYIDIPKESFEQDDKYKGLTVEEIYLQLGDEIPFKCPQLGVEDTELDGEFIEDIAGAIQSSKMQGYMPAGFDREYNISNVDRVNWKTELKDYIQPYSNDWTFETPDRRFMQGTFMIPGLRGDKIVVIVAVDTSGSIGEVELNDFLSEIYSIIRSFDNVEMILMSCDAEAYEPIEVHDRSDLDNFKAEGGGGTSFVPVFDLIEKDSQLKEKGLLVYFTDGYGEFPTDDRGIKTLWLINNQEVTPPFGKVIRYHHEI